MNNKLMYYYWTRVERTKPEKVFAGWISKKHDIAWVVDKSRIRKGELI